MKKNEVRIYADPVTMKRFEGSARVLKVHFSNDERAYCKVRFLAGPPPRVADRWVDHEQLLRFMRAKDFHGYAAVKKAERE